MTAEPDMIEIAPGIRRTKAATKTIWRDYRGAADGAPIASVEMKMNIDTWNLGWLAEYGGERKFGNVRTILERDVEDRIKKESKQ